MTAVSGSMQRQRRWSVTCSQRQEWVVQVASLYALCLLILPGTQVLCQWTSPVRDLVQNTETLERVARVYLESEQDRLNQIKSIVAELSHERTRRDIDQPDLGNPFNAFHEIRKWSTLTRVMHRQDSRVHEMFSPLLNSIRPPNRNALKFSLQNIVRLQAFHDVTADDMRQGLTAVDTPLSYTLSTNEQLEMVEIALQLGQPILAIQWMLHACLDSDNMDRKTVDNIVAKLEPALDQLLHAGLIEESNSDILQRWIHVEERNEATRDSVFKQLLDSISSVKSGVDQQPAGPISDTANFTRCLAPKPAKSLSDFVHWSPVSLSQSFIADMDYLSQYLWKTSFRVEGLRTRVHPLILDIQRRAIMHRALTLAVELAEPFCEECDLSAAIANQTYSFDVKYDSTGHHGYRFRIIPDALEALKRQKMSGIHVLISFRSSPRCTVVPYEGSPAVLASQENAIIWESMDEHYNHLEPFWCPNVDGQRLGVHIFFLTT